MAISALVGGCAPGGLFSGRSRRVQRPERALAAYAEALSARDAERARAQLSAADRKAFDAAGYRKLLALDANEAQELAKQLAHASATRVTAELQLDDGSTVELHLEGDRFVLADPLSRFYGQASPRAALRSFVRAVARDRWDVLLALMPNAERGELDAVSLGQKLAAQREELTRVTAQLASALDAPIEVVGDRATMPYGESFTARLVREEELWKVEDPE